MTKMQCMNLSAWYLTFYYQDLIERQSKHYITIYKQSAVDVNVKPQSGFKTKRTFKHHRQSNIQ